MASTTNYNLRKPVAGARSWDIAANANMDIINDTMDAILAKQREAEVILAALPAVEPIYRGFNMGFDFWERNTTYNQGNADSFIADQWWLENVAGTFSGGQIAGGGNDPFEYFFRLNVQSAGVTANVVNFIPYKPTHSDFFRFCKGKPITFAADLRKNDANVTLRLLVNDGPTTSNSDFQSTLDTWERFVVEHTVSASATTLKVGVEITGTAVLERADVTNCAFALGTHTALPYVPMHPQDDFLGCRAQYQKVGFDIGWFNHAADVVIKRPLLFPTPMIATPGITTVVKGSEDNGSLASLTFTAMDRLSGYITATGSTKTGNNLTVTGNMLTLEVV